ncbi:MAG: type IX secretion system outer membrane channel protein PorV [Thermoflexibacter sp.]
MGQDSTRRVISTAVPFLTITPDARSAGMGDVGVALSPDANATHWNPAKLAFLEKTMGMSISYSPWLQKLVNDMSIAYLSGYYKISKQEAVAMSLRYFNMGSIQFTDLQGRLQQDFNPREIALDGTYSRKLSKEFSMAITGRFVHSNLAGNFSNGPGNVNATPGNVVAADISAYYEKKKIIGMIPTTVAFGLNISNIGGRMTYNNPTTADYIPTNLRLGTGITAEIDEYNKLTFALDINKLLVPTPPIRNGQGQIIKGKDPDRTLVSAMFGSFNDAPNGLREEIQELMFAMGAEYWYKDIFALRGGYFNENTIKGARKYFTLGLGFRYQKFGIDFAYMMPTVQNHPLADTMRFTLLFDFGRSKQEKSVTDEEGAVQ